MCGHHVMNNSVCLEDGSRGEYRLNTHRVFGHNWSTDFVAVVGTDPHTGRSGIVPSSLVILGLVEERWLSCSRKCNVQYSILYQSETSSPP